MLARSVRRAVGALAFMAVPFLAASGGLADRPMRMLPAELPAPVRAAVSRETGGSLEGVRITQLLVDGRLEYGTEWSVGARTLQVRLSDKGKVLGRRESVSVPFAELPAPVRAAASRDLGERTAGARMVREKGTRHYEIAAELPDGEATLTVAPDGRVLRRADQQLGRRLLPPPVLAAVERAAPEARVVEVERVRERDRTLYKVEADTRAQQMSLKIDGGGRLLRRASYRREAVPAWPAPGASATAPPPVAPGQTFVIAAAGDVAEYRRRQDITAALLLRMRERQNLAALLVMGDLQYPRGDYEDFMLDYDRTWGHPLLRAITRPVPGNHEYDEGRSDAQGYFDYFNGPGQRHGPAGDRQLGYYSYDIGDWHFVALNTSDGCRKKIPCHVGSAMHSWLVADLARTRSKCVLAYAHHPRFQHGDVHGDNPRVGPLWDALVDARVDVILFGHEHNFQQLAPLDKAGKVDRARGLRSFIVGTGGADGYLNWRPSLHAEAVEAKVADRFGVLELTLEPAAYRWRFLAADGSAEGETVVQGRDLCR
jgi:acid phosphatase type 7